MALPQLRLTAFVAEAKGEGTTSLPCSRSRKSVKNSNTHPASAPVANTQWDVEPWLLSIQCSLPTWTSLLPRTMHLAAGWCWRPVSGSRTLLLQYL